MKLLKTLAIAGGCAASALALTPTAKAQAGTEFVGQVSLFGMNFCPRGWTSADGQLLPIAQHTALFSLYGTTYGGDGRTTFGLPDLRGRRAIGQGNGPGIGNYPLGQKGGSASFTLTLANLPSHNHTGTMRASNQQGNTANPNNNVLAIDKDGVQIYHNAGSTNNMAADSLVINNNGGNQAVDKVSPYQVLRWCVALTGVYPSRN